MKPCCGLLAVNSCSAQKEQRFPISVLIGGWWLSTCCVKFQVVVVVVVRGKLAVLCAAVLPAKFRKSPPTCVVLNRMEFHPLNVPVD